MPPDQVLHDGPPQTRLADPLPVHEHGHPEDQDGGADAGHGAEGPAVAVARDPRVRVEGKEEAEGS